MKKDKNGKNALKAVDTEIKVVKISNNIRKMLRA